MKPATKLLGCTCFLASEAKIGPISIYFSKLGAKNNIIFIGTPWKTVAFFWQLGSGRVWPRRCKTLWELQIRASANVVTNSVREVGQSPYIL